jgi:hypothetical protein
VGDIGGLHLGDERFVVRKVTADLVEVLVVVRESSMHVGEREMRIGMRRAASCLSFAAARERRLSTSVA